MSLVSKIFADAKRQRKDAFKYALQMCSQDPTLNYTDVFEERCRINASRDVAEIRYVINLIQSDYGEAMQDLARLVKEGQQTLKSLTYEPQSYLITIRPIEGIDVNVFKDKITSLVSRKCFIDGCYSFEQKGTNEDTLGQGLHCHIVCRMTQKSKQNVLRDITSSFNSWIKEGLISDNNIDVRTTHNPAEVVQNYLIDYRSDDGHKELTRECDTTWRTLTGLAPLYPFRK